MKYTVISPEGIPVDLRHVCSYFSMRSLEHTQMSVLWLDPARSLHMHVNSNYNGRIAITMYACTQFTSAKTEGSSNARVHVHTHMSVALSQGSFRARIYHTRKISALCSEVQLQTYKTHVRMCMIYTPLTLSHVLGSAPLSSNILTVS